MAPPLPAPWHYLQATARHTGAVCVFMLYGPDDRLAGAVDAAVLANSPALNRPLRMRELRYGRLTDAREGIVDEVLLAKPAAGLRVMTGHGGVHTARSIESFAAGLGFRNMDEPPISHGDGRSDRDPLLLPLLAGCVTETQAAAVLCAREEWRAGNRGAGVPLALMAPHHICLAGPPNAGKSSLLNRVAGFDRAFVHSDAGATRDAVGHLADLAGYAVLVDDLPGVAAEGDAVLREAWSKAVRRLGLAEAAFFVCDASGAWNADHDAAARVVAGLVGSGKEGASPAAKPIVVVLNKSDRPRAMAGRPWREHFMEADAIATCSLPGGDAAARIAACFGRLARRFFAAGVLRCFGPDA